MTRPILYALASEQFALGLDTLARETAEYLDTLTTLRAQQNVVCAEVTELTAAVTRYRRALADVLAAPNLAQAKILAASALHAPDAK